MFLIAKIVRGRRLLHELEQREKNQAAAAALEAAQSITQVSRRLAARHQHMSGDVVENADEVKTNQKTERRKKAAVSCRWTVSLGVSSYITCYRRKITESSGPVGSTLKHYNYDDKLNRLQRRALRFTWHRLHTRNGGKRVENVFEENSKREDTGSPLDPRIIGRSHGLLRPYGLTGQHWEKLGEIIIDVVLAQEAVRDLPGAGQAWVIFTACLVDQLRAGFDECRGANQGLTKRDAVLYHATKHLYDLVSVKIKLTCEF
ncbi:unnamed protein product [Angiostrongylus costaricensis]|uniref:GLOBIN domain-containing protein n=1 Tax=Angiostrongylus costaricensis TaxID=334426 RepID=A0A158PKR5_ANGCS|nr:unnamed protein product [Angiostrongylus costaricensis]